MQGVPRTIDEFYADVSSNVEFMLKETKDPDFEGTPNKERARRARNKRQSFIRYRQKLRQVEKQYSEATTDKERKELEKELEQLEDKCAGCYYAVGMFYMAFLREWA